MRYNSKMDAARTAISAAENRALEAVGVFLEGEAINRCPTGVYDDGRVGGNLKGSISHKTNTTSPKGVVVGAAAKYAVYVEKGTGLYAEDGNGRRTPWFYESNIRTGELTKTSGQRPQPFLKPSVTKNLAKIQRLFKEQLKL